MSLWAFGVDHGIVVNIGQGQTIAIPVIDGQVGASLACSSEVASGKLTQFMCQLVSRRFDWYNSRLMTFCRDLKEAHCYVAPPAPRSSGSLQARLAAGEDASVRSVSIEGPHTESGNAADFELNVERVLVPEALFDTSMSGERTLPDLVIDCAAKALKAAVCDAEGARRLLRQVVLVGGAADIPGIRPRLEHELRTLVREGCAPHQILEAVDDPDDIFVLNPPRGADGPLTSPRFVPFVGGCVRAVSSEGLLPLRIDPSKKAEDTSDESTQLASNPSFRAWARNIPNLGGPAIFRTGGGGGEDDRIWRILQLALAQASDEDHEDEQDRYGNDH